MSYGQRIKYTTADGLGGSFEISACQSADEARDECIRFALMGGWTNPKWWQFWRWSDTKFPQQIVDAASQSQTREKELQE